MVAIMSLSYPNGTKHINFALITPARCLLESDISEDASFKEKVSSIEKNLGIKFNLTKPNELHVTWGESTYYHSGDTGMGTSYKVLPDENIMNDFNRMANNLTESITSDVIQNIIEFNCKDIQFTEKGFVIAELEANENAIKLAQLYRNCSNSVLTGFRTSVLAPKCHYREGENFNMHITLGKVNDLTGMKHIYEDLNELFKVLKHIKVELESMFKFSCSYKFNGKRTEIAKAYVNVLEPSHVHEESKVKLFPIPQKATVENLKVAISNYCHEKSFDINKLKIEENSISNEVVIHFNNKSARANFCKNFKGISDDFRNGVCQFAKDIDGPAIRMDAEAVDTVLRFPIKVNA